MGKRSLCPWNQPHFQKNSDKSLLSPEQNSLKKSETGFYKRNTAEDNKAKLNVFPNIPCTFFPFKVSAFLQIFISRNLLFLQVLRRSVFRNNKCLKTSNKRTHIPLFINQFVSLMELKMQWLIKYWTSTQSGSLEQRIMLVKINSCEGFIVFLTLYRMGKVAKTPPTPDQVFPCNYYKRRN